MSERPGLVSAAVDASRAILSSLPPAFLLLVLINAGFIFAVLWFLDVQMEQRMTMANRILDACLKNGIPR